MNLLKFYFYLFFIYVKCDNDMEAVYKFDYCKLNCGKDEHSACDCSPKLPRIELTRYPDIPTFRKLVVDSHNELRNKLACGGEKRPPPDGFPSASNMMIVNYDLELEHIARCHALSHFKLTDRRTQSPHDKCRPTRNKQNTGQNILGAFPFCHFNQLAATFKSKYHWYAEINLLTNNSLYAKLEHPSKYNGTIFHFTQMIRWSADRIGCVRVSQPENLIANKFSLICNYGSSTSTSPQNMVGDSLYKSGEPCSACPPEAKQCNSKYKCLCGKQEHIPKKIYTASSNQTVLCSSVSLVTFFLFLLNYINL